MACKTHFMAAAILCMLFFQACGPIASQKTQLDTPFHHVSNGMQLLKIGKIDAAYREFKRAELLNPAYSATYIGLGLVYGCKGDVEKGFQAMKQAVEYAGSNEEKAFVQVGYMRLYTMVKDRKTKDWLERVTEAFQRATQAAPDLQDPYFFMGIAYTEAKIYDKATAQFIKVLEMGDTYKTEATKALEGIGNKNNSTTVN